VRLGAGVAILGLPSSSEDLQLWLRDF
jgi:hypothetical protein